MNNYEWKEVAPKMVGNWPNAIAQITGVQLRDYHPKKHYPCPICGGSDRFRFDDRKPGSGRPDGSGGYFCNQCGGGDGMKLLTGIAGISFSEAVNLLGAFVNAQPVEQRRAAVQAIATAPRLSYGKEMKPEDVANQMMKTKPVDSCPLAVLEGISPASMRMVMRADYSASNGDTWRLCVPVNHINSDGSLGQACNIARLDLNGAVTFLAGAITYNAATYIQGNQNLVLCERWADGWHLHHQTGATVLICWNVYNIDHVAYLLGEKVAGILARAEDIDTMIYAEERNVMVWAMKGKKVVARCDATKLINKVIK